MLTNLREVRWSQLQCGVRGGVDVWRVRGILLLLLKGSPYHCGNMKWPESAHFNAEGCPTWSIISHSSCLQGKMTKMFKTVQIKASTMKKMWPIFGQRYISAYTWITIHRCYTDKIFVYPSKARRAWCSVYLPFKTNETCDHVTLGYVRSVKHSIADMFVSEQDSPHPYIFMKCCFQIRTTGWRWFHLKVNCLLKLGSFSCWDHEWWPSTF